MRSLMLDVETWDLCLDSAGQIKLTDGPYCTAQKVANATRLFTDDAWYDPDKGIPHFEIELGHTAPSISILRSRLRQEAINISGVLDAEVNITGLTDRTVNGDIRLELDTGESAEVTF